MPWSTVRKAFAPFWLPPPTTAEEMEDFGQPGTSYGLWVCQDIWGAITAPISPLTQLYSPIPPLPAPAVVDGSNFTAAQFQIGLVLPSCTRTPAFVCHQL